MKTPAATITVIGAGSWGTALALLLCRNGHTVYLWGHQLDKIAAMQTANCNLFYLPDYPFPPQLMASTDLTAALSQSELMLIAVPSDGFAAIVKQLVPLVSHRPGLVSATKGLDPHSGQLLHQVVQTYLGCNYPLAILSGPSFAKEVAAGLPTAVNIASQDLNFCQKVCQYFANPYFRVYPCNDIIGVQLAGAIKNVLAIATGIADGMGFGANAKSALITRGLAEMTRLGKALGACGDTFTGLAGIGDLILTSTDNQSRNRRFGLAIGKGASVSEALADIHQVVEGMRNSQDIYHLAKRSEVYMPIVEQVYRILFKHISLEQAVEALLAKQAFN